MIDTTLFPYSSFPIRLEIPKENRIAWFKDEVDLQKHVKRYELKPKEIIILNANETPQKVAKKSPKSTKSTEKSSTTGGKSSITRKRKRGDNKRNISSSK